LKKGGNGRKKWGKNAATEMEGGGERSSILKKGWKGRKNGKECSNIDGWRRRKKCNIEERREREKKNGENAAT
jgi:hypothetical protein